MKDYSDFRQMITRIESLFRLPDGFLKTMYVNPRSEARYQKLNASSSIFLNLARFDQNKNAFFWLFTVARELSYIKTRRFGYYFVTQLRDILTVGVKSAEEIPKI